MNSTSKTKAYIGWPKAMGDPQSGLQEMFEPGLVPQLPAACQILVAISRIIPRTDDGNGISFGRYSTREILCWIL
jgi:hypothetical protein